MPAFWRNGLDPLHEPTEIFVARGILTDDARQDRRVPYKIYHATNSSPRPLVLWSHGLGGSRDGAGFISRFLAGNGYTVLHVQHAGTDSSLWEGKPGHPWDVIRATTIPPQATVERYRDIPFILDHLSDLDRAHPEAGGIADAPTIGMSGHSFGAHTTQIMAGQRTGRDGVPLSLKEPRFRAGILYSPVPAGGGAAHLPPDEIYGGISLPLFHMTGTKDESPIEGFGFERRLDIFKYSGGPDQHLLTLHGGDHMVFNGSRGKLENNPHRADHEVIIKIAALAFWDCYLRGDDNARSWLTGGRFSAWLRDRGQYEFRA